MAQVTTKGRLAKGKLRAEAMNHKMTTKSLKNTLSITNVPNLFGPAHGIAIAMDVRIIKWDRGWVGFISTP